MVTDDRPEAEEQKLEECFRRQRRREPIDRQVVDEEHVRHSYRARVSQPKKTTKDQRDLQ
jgi:hypothetical protein